MKPILDVCCGGRMFWFDKQDSRATFCDIRNEQHTLCDGRELTISPDVQCDFTNLPFDDESFYLVVFDPPHLTNVGANSWLAKKYGRLQDNWQQMITDGFKECFRVLKPNGTLIFKWSETDIKVNQILALTEQKPVIGHKSGKTANTHWIVFMKAESNETQN